MALEPNVYSGRQFEIYFAHDGAGDTADTDVGVFNNDVSEFRRLDIDGFALPALNPTLEFEMRSGAGRVARTSQVFVSEKGTVREFSVSGRATKSDILAFLTNAVGKNHASAELVVNSAHLPGAVAYTGTEANISENDFSKTLSFAFSSPISGEVWKLAGCVCTSYEISADIGTASGRFNFSATFQTGWKPTKAALDMSNASDNDGLNIFLTDLVNHTLNDGSGDITPVISSFGFTINNPTHFIGQQGTNGDPEIVAKQVPELETLWRLGVKYDEETAKYVDSFKAGTNIKVYVGKAAESAGVPTPTGSAGFAFYGRECKLIGLEGDFGDVARLNMEGKCLDDGTNSVVEWLVDIA